MFLGVVPDTLIEQITRSIDFRTWKEVFVCCSGTFRMERGVLTQHPDARVTSNDVSIFTVPIGRYLLGQETPITFTGELEFAEDLLRNAPYISRIAAIMVASDMSKYAVGGRNRYKDQYLAFYRANFGPLVKATEAKLTKSFDKIRISGFFAGDWVEHAREAMKRGAGIAAFPPFFKGGYEKMFEWIGDNIEWDAPSYNLYDPSDLKGIFDEIEASGVPYCVLTDQVFEGYEPTVEWVSGRRLPHYCYTSKGTSSFFRAFYSGKPFRYKPIDITKLTENTEVRIVPTDGQHIAHIKDVYLQKGIVHSSGRFNFFVYLDDMLAGAVIYDNEKYGSPGPGSGLYLLSDLSLTREARISKLIARLTLSRAVIRIMEKRDLKRFMRISTTAFTRHAVSMKYRGTGYEKSSSRPSTSPLDPPGTNIVQYVGEPIEDTLQQIYSWWWGKHGKSEVGKARNRAAEHRPADAA